MLREGYFLPSFLWIKILFILSIAIALTTHDEKPKKGEDIGYFQGKWEGKEYPQHLKPLL